MTAPREIRRYRRMNGWDYRRGAVLFVTIVTEPRRAILGRVVEGRVELSPLGEIVAHALDDMTRFNPGIVVYGRTVMPDHIHFNVHIQAGLAEPLKVFGKAIARFKNFTLKQAKLMGLAGPSPAISTALGLHRSPAISTALGLHRSPAISTALGLQPSPAISTALGLQPSPAISIALGPGGHDSASILLPEYCARSSARYRAAASGDGRATLPVELGAQVCGEISAAASGDGRAALGLWQQGCHDRLCLCRAFIDATERYIAYNAQKWQLMYGAGSPLRIHEPLEAACLDPGDYWKGVGNVALLNEKLVSLRVSRRCSPTQIGEIVARMNSAVSQGYVILSGFVSTGEKAVRDMLCATPGARFIRILPSCIPNARFRPESRYVPAFAEGRYLEIAQGNDEVAFGRAACLDYNAEIAEITQASPGGMALYWKADGLHRLDIP